MKKQVCYDASDDHYHLNQVSLCSDGSCFALVYGNDFDQVYSGGFVVVYDFSGKELFRTEKSFYLTKYQFGKEIFDGNLGNWGSLKVNIR